MKLINYILCILLALCYVNTHPVNELFKRELKLKNNWAKDLNLKPKDYFSGGWYGNVPDGICTEETVFTNYTKKTLKSDESFKVDISSNNILIICNNKKQIPVMFGFHIKKSVIAQRFKYNKYNGIYINSCKGNEYVTVKCEIPEYY
ncbi:hypothetical protein PIROE2DRAFT_13972 [Piromyces sp. E2]|nr:hypothetical protein PIROE2DRAFT_13972 [Piromyces sp. E2]|eukprot:OUM60289.1 hypothetical protein PIROE2DRAFT_13972 [Piromyces sp. E2]